MSYDRVLPKPVALHHDSLPRPSNLLDHKIMNDLPASHAHVHAALPHRPDPIGSACRYSGGPQAPQQLTVLNRPKNGMSKNEQSPPPVRPADPMLATKDLAIRDRSVSSSGSSSPVKSAHGDVKWCLCQPAPKVPRPRNGEWMMSAQSPSEHGKCILFCRCCSSWNLEKLANGTRAAFILYRQHYQAAVVHRNPGMANPEISKIIGAQWKSITDEERGKWKALANVSDQKLMPRGRRLTSDAGRESSPFSAVPGLSLPAQTLGS